MSPVALAKGEIQHNLSFKGNRTVINFRMLKQSDYLLWGATAILIILGFFMIASSTISMQMHSGGSSFTYIGRHVFAFIIALIFMFLAAYADYNNWKNVSIFLYVFIIIILSLVILFGTAGGGAQRWLRIGFISFQPSEIAKLIIIISLASYLAGRNKKLNSLLDLVPVFALVGVPFVLIFKQPDLGTSLVFIAISFGMLAWSKTNPILLVMLLTPLLSIFLKSYIIIWVVYFVVLFAIMHMGKLKLIDRFLIIGANIGFAYAVPFFFGMLKAYQRRRILAFLNPSLDPRGVGYHSLQAKVAVGSGGFWGRGLFRGTQTQLQFIPKQFSDFIFSVVGEELGFVGSVLVLTLFGIIIWRSIKIAMESKDAFGSLLASGIAVMYTFHVVLNVGMTLGLLPVVGIPLPLMSFGGTSLLVNLVCIGILQSICMRKLKFSFY